MKTFSPEVEARIQTPEFQEKFWDRIQTLGEDDCWHWMDTRNPAGYGAMTDKRVPYSAHRLAYRIHFGIWPNVVCHSCDTPACCNPKHLIDGTTRQNVMEKIERGRANPPKGENHHNAKLSNEIVSSIRNEYASGEVTQKQLAEKHGVRASLVSLVVNLKIWRHV